MVTQPVSRRGQDRGFQWKHLSLPFGKENLLVKDIFISTSFKGAYFFRENQESEDK